MSSDRVRVVAVPGLLGGHYVNGVRIEGPGLSVPVTEQGEYDADTAPA